MKRKALLMLGLVVALGATNVAGAFAAEGINDQDARSTATFAFDNSEDEDGEGVDPTDPVNPEEPDENIDPDDEDEGGTGNTGRLRIDYVSDFKFPAQSITNGEQTFYADLVDAEDKDGNDIQVPNFVQVGDHRGLGAGWKLQVEQTKQFTVISVGADVDDSLLGRELTGAELTIDNIVTNTNTEDEQPVIGASEPIVLGKESGVETVMTAPKGKGFGTHVAHFGRLASAGAEGETASKSVKLVVPANATKVEGTYEAELTWTLCDTP